KPHSIRRYRTIRIGPSTTPLWTQRLGRSHRSCTVLAYLAGVRYFRTGLVLHRMGGSSMSIDLDSLTSWDADWSQLSVVVTGIGVTGFSVADTLAELGAAVLVLDGKDTVENRQAADTLKIVGVKDVLLGDNAVAGLPEASAIGNKIDLVITSPGWRPKHPVLEAARKAAIPIWGDVEFAWRVRQREGKRTAKWLV